MLTFFDDAFALCITMGSNGYLSHRAVGANAGCSVPQGGRTCAARPYERAVGANAGCSVPQGGLSPVDANNNEVDFSKASITVTLEQNDTTGVSDFGQPKTGFPIVLDSGIVPQGDNCGWSVDATQIGMFASPYQNAFIVHVHNGTPAACSTPGHAFFFKVCARP